jgi:hypothetical protein
MTTDSLSQCSRSSRRGTREVSQLSLWEASSLRTEPEAPLARLGLDPASGC